ncbi:hypothetical protein [Senegalia massiliensis]|nr:hypothetical protein [Senegalia massiliensis]
MDNKDDLKKHKDKINYIAVGVALGVSLGAAIGAGLDAINSKKTNK